MRTTPALLACALLAAAPAARAAEGKWTPQQVLQQGPAWVKAQGFGLPLQRLWDAKKGGGLLANAVQLPGCSGSFVSAEGLLITNHHCVVGILQQHSTPQANLGGDGYLARTPRGREAGEGLPHPGAARVPRRDAGGAGGGPGRRRRPGALQGGRGGAEGAGRRLRGEARHPLPVRRVRRRAVLHADRVRGAERRAAGLRAAASGRQLRRRGGQLDVAAPHRRLRPAARLQGRQALRAALLLPGLARRREAGRRPSRCSATRAAPTARGSPTRWPSARGAGSRRCATSTASGSGSCSRRAAGARRRRRSRSRTTCAGSRTRRRTPRGRSPACAGAASSRSSARPRRR